MFGTELQSSRGLTRARLQAALNMPPRHAAYKTYEVYISCAEFRIPRLACMLIAVLLSEEPWMVGAMVGA